MTLNGLSADQKRSFATASEAKQNLAATRRSKACALPLQRYLLIDEFELESGEIIQNVVVAFTMNGLLNENGDNAIVICHALSGSANVQDWWSSQLDREDTALDVGNFCIICCNSLGSPYGSSSPLSHGPAFPRTTVRDDVHIHKKVLNAVGVKSIHCVIGGSMGGMLAMEWCFLYKSFVKSAVLLATAAIQGAWPIAWAESQRATIVCDPKFRNGYYGQDPPASGLSAARMAAMLIYRTSTSFEHRFGRSMCVENKLNRNSSSNGGSSHDRGKPESQLIFSAHSYLRYQGQKFKDRFDANCYLHILDKIDTHDITRGRCAVGFSKAERLKLTLAKIQQPALVIGVSTDILYPPSEQQVIYENMPNAEFAIIESDNGHDGFMLEETRVNALLNEFLGKIGTRSI